MKKISFIMLGILYALASVAQKQHFSLTMPSLLCTKTTEDGEDEVYQMVAWVKSDGTKSSLMLPTTASFERSMNDGNRLNSDIDWGEIIGFDLEPGQRIDIVGVIMERDEGTVRAYTNFYQELFRTSIFRDAAKGQAPTFQLIPTILARIANTYKFSNADDYIGAYICSFELTGTGLKRNYLTVFNVADKTNPQGPKPKKDSNFVTWRFGGDGSAYRAKLQLNIFMNPGPRP